LKVALSRQTIKGGSKTEHRNVKKPFINRQKVHFYQLYFMTKEFTIPGLRQRITSLFSLLVVLSIPASAQYNLALNANSTQTPVTGPSVQPQYGNFIINTEKGTASSGINVTASFTAQTYNNVADNGTGTGLQFGATQNTAGITANGQGTLAAMENVSSPASSLFDDNGDADHKIDVTDNYAFSVFCTTRPLAAAGLATNGRYLMGQLTLTFSSPVDNPTLHIIGMGGTAGQLGISSELELVSQGAVLNKLSGNNNLTIEGNSLLNSAVNPDASSLTGAASGSVQVAGTDITSLTFKVYMKGDGGADKWEQTNQYNGDRWMIGVSVNENKPVSAQVLPIYITNFNAVHDADCAAHLRWKTNTELGISDFFVEHSVDGITFNEIYTFESQGKAEGDYYSYTYHYAANGANYFRIRTKDIMSDSNYGPVVKVLVTCKEPLIQAFPNPAQDYLKVRGVSNGNTIQLSNMFGKVMRNQSASSTEADLDLNGLQPGIYVLTVANERGQEITRTRINKQ
jgi:hypothetical protein